MTIDPVAALLAGFIANVIATILGALKLLSMVHSQGERWGKLEVKVDTMWDVMLKGAMASAVRGGVMRAESPMKLNPLVREQFGDLGTTIKDFYKDNHLSRYSDSEVILVLARVFGNELLKTVCIPYGMNMGAALIAAVQLCREDVDAGSGTSGDAGVQDHARPAHD